MQSYCKDLESCEATAHLCQGTRDQSSPAARLHRPAKASTCLGMPRQSAKAEVYIHLDFEYNVKYNSILNWYSDLFEVIETVILR